MKIVTCYGCGWVGLASQCDNGIYEPPTCLMCESTSLSYSEDEYETPVDKAEDANDADYSVD